MKIHIKKQAQKEIEATIKINNEINQKEEIAAWLIGNIQEQEKELTITIEKIHIPKQTITGTEVEISGESMIETLKELGTEETTKIIGHWHLHGFAEKETNWSATDEEKIKDLMNKDREIMIFLLSSQTKTKARIEIRTKAKIRGTEYTIPLSYDNLEFTTEKEEETETEKRIRNEIEKKVEKKKYNSTITTIDMYGKWLKQENKEENTTEAKILIESMNYDVQEKEKTIEIIMKTTFLEYLKTQQKININEYKPSFIMEQGRTTKIIIKKKHKKEITKLCDLLEREEYRYEINQKTRNNIDYYDEYQETWEKMREYDLY